MRRFVSSFRKFVNPSDDFDIVLYKNSIFTIFQYATFNVYMMMVATLLPIFFSFYLGSWCDIFGRKLLIKVYLISKIFGKTGLILCSYFMNSSKYWLLLCYIPYGIAGLILIVLFVFLDTIFIILTVYLFL
jgi:MFS family permease